MFLFNLRIKQEGYAAMNQHQVGLAESTCPARFANHNDGKNGGALLDIVGEYSGAIFRAILVLFLLVNVYLVPRLCLCKFCHGVISR